MADADYAYGMPKHVAVPYKRQWLDFTCGPVVLQMVLKYFRMPISRWQAIRLCQTARATGTTRRHLVAAVRSFGLHVHAHGNGTIAELRKLTGRNVPVIVNYREPADNEGHYAIVVAVTARSVVLHDPYHGPRFRLSQREFMRRWHGQHVHANRRWLMAIGQQRNLLKHS